MTKLYILMFCFFDITNISFFFTKFCKKNWNLFVAIEKLPKCKYMVWAGGQKIQGHLNFYLSYFVNSQNFTKLVNGWLLMPP